MQQAIEIDPISTEQTRVCSGSGTVTAVRAAGAPLPTGWPSYIIAIRAHDDSGQPPTPGTSISAIVAATSPLARLASESLAFGRDCHWRIEHRRLAHIAIDKSLAELEEGVDTVAILVAFEDAPPPAELALDLAGLRAGEVK